MATYFYSSDPARLLRTFRELIDQGHVKTWAYDDTGDFTHNRPEFIFKAWMRPHIEQQRLVFGILGRNDETLKVSIYGIYHGRFTESLLNHCDLLFTSALTSSMKDAAYDFFD